MLECKNPFILYFLYIVMLKGVERVAFKKSLTSPMAFRKIVRPAAYKRAEGDPEIVHEMALEALNNNLDIVKEVSESFDFPSLHVDICGKDVMPFGPAEGLDKNFLVTYALSQMFGIVTGGTVVVDQRDGNPPPRVVMDVSSGIGYNAQGFPSGGLNVAKGNLRLYREQGGERPVISSICGLPERNGEPDLNNSYRELETLATELGPDSDGIVWNPFSPNTDALKLLRTREVFEESAGLIRKIIGDKLLLVKMGPYDDISKSQEWLSLITGFMKGDGDGIVAVNTYMIPKENVPSEEWGYDRAGASGKFLQEYRQRAITDFRQEFGKEKFVIGVGGIDSAEEAFAAFEAGANALAAYTPYIFSGFGLLPQIAKGVERKLKDRGYDTLKDFQKELGIAA